MTKKDIDIREDALNNEILPDSFIEKIAEIVDDELNLEIEEYEKNETHVPEEHDSTILEIARSYDAKLKKNTRTMKRRRALRIVAVFAVAVIGLGSIGISASEAFRMKVFSLFENKDGTVVFRNDTEYELLKDWTKYWYPEYLPEGYYLLSAEDSKMQKTMMFESVDIDSRIRIYEKNERVLSMIDIDTNIYEKVYINSFEGYMYINEDNNSMDLIWQTYDSVLEISISNTVDDNLIIEIAENMKYIE